MPPIRVVNYSKCFSTSTGERCECKPVQPARQPLVFQVLESAYKWEWQRKLIREAVKAGTIEPVSGTADTPPALVFESLIAVADTFGEPKKVQALRNLQDALSARSPKEPPMPARPQRKPTPKRSRFLEAAAALRANRRESSYDDGHLIPPGKDLPYDGKDGDLVPASEKTSEKMEQDAPDTAAAVEKLLAIVAEVTDPDIKAKLQEVVDLLDPEAAAPVNDTTAAAIESRFPRSRRDARHLIVDVGGRAEQARRERAREIQEAKITIRRELGTNHLPSLRAQTNREHEFRR